MTEQRALAAPTERVGAEPVRRTVNAFIRMWAVAHVIHLCGANDYQLDTLWNITTVVAALALVLRPTSGRWLVVLAVAQLADLVWEMPFSPDHWMLIGFVNLVILITLATKRSLDTVVIAAGFPAARLVVLIGYSAAAIAKYNTTFLDPVTSCAAAIADTASFGLAERLDVAPLWVIAVIATESLIPILLAIPATRRHGVRVAMAFHFCLSVSPVFAVVDFTAALFALFLLFLSDRDIAGLLDRVNRVAKRSAVVRDARRVPWLTATLALVAFGFLGYLSFRVAAALVFVASEIYLLGILLAALWSWRASRDTRAFGRVRWAYVPVVALLIGCVLSPYAGLRTTGVFTMFSNLSTEGASPNHLFMPSMRLVDWQDDMVTIESTNDPAMETAEGGNLAIPLIELRRMAMDDPDLVVEGELDGVGVTFGPEPGQTLLEPLPAWQHKMLHFRPVPVGDQPFCSVS